METSFYFDQECTNSPYGNQFFPEYAEPIPGESSQAFSKAAKENQIYLMAGNKTGLRSKIKVIFNLSLPGKDVFKLYIIIAGSIPERDGEKLYNTALVFNPEGDMVAKFRKVK